MAMAPSAEFNDTCARIPSGMVLVMIRYRLERLPLSRVSMNPIRWLHNSVM